MCICEDSVCLRRFCVFVEVCRDFECICGGFVYIYGSFCEFVKFCGVLVFMVILCVIVNIFNLYCGVLCVLVEVLCLFVEALNVYIYSF